MDFFFVILIVAVVIGGMFLLNRYRGFEGYKRRLPTSGRGPSRASARDTQSVDTSGVYTPTIIAGSGDGGSHHGSADCGAGHGGDGGGGCSDGGGGGGGH